MTKRRQMSSENESLKRKKDELDRKTKEILLELKLSEIQRKNLEKHHAECEKKESNSVKRWTSTPEIATSYRTRCQEERKSWQ